MRNTKALVVVVVVVVELGQDLASVLYHKDSGVGRPGSCWGKGQDLHLKMRPHHLLKLQRRKKRGKGVTPRKPRAPVPSFLSLSLCIRTTGFLFHGPRGCIGARIPGPLGRKGSPLTTTKRSRDPLISSQAIHRKEPGRVPRG